MIAITVLYPKSASSTFDRKYYHETHVPLVGQKWNSMGLKDVSILHGMTGPDGNPPAFEVIAVLKFESMEAFGAAAAAHGSEVLGDIPNFTNVQPVLQFNEIAA